MVNFSEAMAETLRFFEITKQSIADQTGLNLGTIHCFLTGKKAMRHDNLEKIIHCLPKEAQDYYFQIVYPNVITMEMIISSATAGEKAEMLRLIAGTLAVIPPIQIKPMINPGVSKNINAARVSV